MWQNNNSYSWQIWCVLNRQLNNICWVLNGLLKLVKVNTAILEFISQITFQKNLKISLSLALSAWWLEGNPKIWYLKNKLKLLWSQCLNLFFTLLWRFFVLKTQGCNCLENLRYYKISICVQHVCDNLNECSTQNLVD